VSAARVYEERLPPEEFARLEARARAELAGPEGEEVRQQIAWFQRRYATPLERLAYIRRKCAEIATSAPASDPRALEPALDAAGE
jgi:hypothetical protein